MWSKAENMEKKKLFNQQNSAYIRNTVYISTSIPARNVWRAEDTMDRSAVHCTANKHTSVLFFTLFESLVHVACILTVTGKKSIYGKTGRTLCKLMPRFKPRSPL